jgi:hypothetical protein
MFWENQRESKGRQATLTRLNSKARIHLGCPPYLYTSKKGQYIVVIELISLNSLVVRELNVCI